MDSFQLIKRICDDGIEAVKLDYARPDQDDKRRGSIAGFEACRGLTPNGLAELLNAAHDATEDARHREAADYWWFRCHELEVEWTCNVMSAALANMGLPVIIQPTCRGAMKAAEILGVAR